MKFSLGLSLLTLVSQFAVAAPMPPLDKSAPKICPAVRADEWAPNEAQVAALEKALPAFLALSKAKPVDLPAPGVVYARHYEGVTRDGKRYIYGSFYPLPLPAGPELSPVCKSISDGGNFNWRVTFDPQSGVIVNLSVNGIA